MLKGGSCQSNPPTVLKMADTVSSGILSFSLSEMMLWNPHRVRVSIENDRRFAYFILLSFDCHGLECVAGIKVPCLQAKIVVDAGTQRSRRRENSRLLDDERLLRMLRLLWGESRRKETARRRLAVVVNTQGKERMIKSV